MSECNAESLAEMDAQIRYHETQALSLKFQRNKHTPISKLSQDVLLQIFLTARDLAEEWDLSKVLLRITHVCKHWRYIAIHAPTFWTRPPTQYCGPQWTRITLQRAKMVPLDVLLDFDYSRLATNELVLANVPRISKLSITSSAHDLGGLSNLIPERAPQLKDLQIIREFPLLLHDDSDFDNDDVHELVLPRTAFQEAPQLRRLTLKGVELDFDSPLLSNLTKLSLKLLSTDGLPSWSQLTGALRRMPLLEELHLDRVFPTATTPILDHGTVDLPNLQVIDVDTDTVSQLQEFLSLIVISRPKHFSVKWLREGDPEMSQAAAIFQTVARMVNARKFGDTFAALEITSKCSDELVRCLARSTEGCLVQIAFPSTGSEWCDTRVIGNFTDALHLTSITYLSLDADRSEYDVNALYELLYKLPLLRTATTGRLAAFNFFGCLDPRLPYRYPNHRNAKKPCLTELKSVIRMDVNLNDYYGWAEEVAAVTLENRQNEGIQLQEFTFRNVTGLTADALEVFTDAILKVVVEPSL